MLQNSHIVIQFLRMNISTFLVIQISFLILPPILALAKLKFLAPFQLKKSNPLPIFLVLINPQYPVTKIIY